MCARLQMHGFVRLIVSQRVEHISGVAVAKSLPCSIATIKVDTPPAARVADPEGEENALSAM